ncbi:MAG: anti-sigma factor domain-containing protein [Acidimicrobiales bacterium]
MIADPEHERLAEFLGAYALDAVEPSERQLVEGHLEACPRCRYELDGLRKVAADLAMSWAHEGEQPPAALWDRIAAQIGAGAGDRSGQVVALPSDLAGRSRRRSHGRTTRHQLAWLGGAAAAAAAVAIAGLAVGLVQSQGQVHQLQSAIAGRGSNAAVRAALLSPGRRVVELRSTAGTDVAEIVVRHDGIGYVVHTRMTPLPAVETYQLWASIDGRPISLGLLGREPVRGAAFSLGTSAAAARELMVTIEPSGGVSVPGQAPIATAPLSLA